MNEPLAESKAALDAAILNDTTDHAELRRLMLAHKKAERLEAEVEAEVARFGQMIDGLNARERESREDAALAAEQERKRLAGLQREQDFRWLSPRAFRRKYGATR